MTLHRIVKHGLHVVSWVTILATLGVMCVGYYLYFVQGNPPIEFLNLPFPVDKKVYRPGDAVTLLVKYNRRVNSLVTRSVYLNDSYPTPLELTTDRGITPTGTGTVLISYVIPPTYVPAEGDDYYVSGTSVYHVNFLRDRAVAWRSETFHIAPPPGVAPRPSVHRAASGTGQDLDLIWLIERSHASASSAASATPSSAASSATPLFGASSASSASAGVLDSVLLNPVREVKGGLNGVPHPILPLPGL